MTDGQLNLHQRILYAKSLLAEVPWVKDCATSQYKSVPIDQIRQEVARAETEAGIVVIPVSSHHKTIEKDGKVYCQAVIELDYINADDPSDFKRIVISGDAQDAGDKGWNKAESAAYKNLYKGMYYIGERSDDPDSISNNEADLLKVYRASEDVRAKIDAMVAAELPKVLEAERKRVRDAKAKAAGTDRFFAAAKPAPVPAEDLGIPQDVYMDGAEIMARRQMAKDAVDIDEAKRVLMQVYRKDPQSLDRYVQMEDGRQPPAWSDDHIRSAYLDYMEGSD